MTAVIHLQLIHTRADDVQGDEIKQDQHWVVSVPTESIPETTLPMYTFMFQDKEFYFDDLHADLQYNLLGYEGNGKLLIAVLQKFVEGAGLTGTDYGIQASLEELEDVRILSDGLTATQARAAQKFYSFNLICIIN